MHLRLTVDDALEINYRYGGRSINLKTIIRTEGSGGILRMQVGNIEKAAPRLRNALSKSRMRLVGEIDA